MYGVSRGQDVTDLGWQIADITVNADSEIIYVDLTSDIVRTADATEEQADDATNIAEGEYGEIWYDGNDAYADKNFDTFENAVFGIVDDVDEDEVYFKGDADLPTPMNDLDLRDDYAFYLVGEGFIEAADLEEGDVLYTEDLQSGETLVLAYRPVEAILG